MGIGLTAGPVISSIAFNFLGYSGTNFFFGIFIVVMGLVTVYGLLPKRLDSTEEEAEGVPLSMY